MIFLSDNCYEHMVTGESTRCAEKMLTLLYQLIDIKSLEFVDPQCIVKFQILQAYNYRVGNWNCPLYCSREGEFRFPHSVCILKAPSPFLTDDWFRSCNFSIHFLSPLYATLLNSAIFHSDNFCNKLYPL